MSVEDYLANMDRFRTEAARRGISIAFLTRPHKLAPEELSKNSTWRGSVPQYNEALRAWGRASNVPVLDAQHYFEQLSTDLFSDECHFTPQGYERMAQMVASGSARRGRAGSSGGERQQAAGSRSGERNGESASSGRIRPDVERVERARPSLCRELERFVRGLVVLELGDTRDDLGGSVATEDGVDQLVELHGELVVGERVAVVAGRELRPRRRAGCRRRASPSRGWECPRDSPAVSFGSSTTRVRATRSSRAGSLSRSAVNWRAETWPSKQRDGRAIRQAMVGGLAGLGAPFLGVLADDLDGRAERGDLEVADALRVADLTAQVERRGDGRLAVVFGGHELDRGLRQHPVAVGGSTELRRA